MSRPSPTAAGLTGLVTLLLIAGCSVDSETAPPVELMRTPDGGIQPMAEVDEDGTVHLIYFLGEPSAGNVYYVRKELEDEGFSEPIRVNSEPNSVIATGTVRGAHLAVGKNGRAHVAWMGSSEATPRGPDDAAPMLYAHSRNDGQEFTEQRNVLQHATGLDGGGTVAADRDGNVHVLWHAGGPDAEEEPERRVWVAASADGGTSFEREVPFSSDRLGACGCCGMSATHDASGNLYALFRGAETEEQRDLYLLRSSTPQSDVESDHLDDWAINLCPMSSSSMHVAGDRVVVSWDNREQVAYAVLDDSGAPSIVHAPGEGDNRKHPAVAINKQGDVLLAWTEETGWAEGGSLHWQLFDRGGSPMELQGEADDVPVWSRPAAYVNSDDGGFTIVY